MRNLFGASPGPVFGKPGGFKGEKKNGSSERRLKQLENAYARISFDTLSEQEPCVPLSTEAINQAGMGDREENNQEKRNRQRNILWICVQRNKISRTLGKLSQ